MTVKKERKKGSGGKRPGQGRPTSFPTDTISVRGPISALTKAKEAAKLICEAEAKRIKTLSKEQQIELEAVAVKEVAALKKRRV